MLTKEQLAALGLKEDAKPEEITNAINALKGKTLNTEQLEMLGLKEDAKPEEVKAALAELTNVDKVINALKKAGYKIINGGRGLVNEDEDGDVDARCATLENKMGDMMKVHEKLANAHQKLIDKYAAMEESTKNAEAQAIVNKYKDNIVNATPAVLEIWVERVKRDPVKGEEDLKALPVNKKAPEFPIVNKLKDNELPTTALSFMAKVKNELNKAGYKQYLMAPVN